MFNEFEGKTVKTINVVKDFSHHNFTLLVIEFTDGSSLTVDTKHLSDSFNIRIT